MKTVCFNPKSAEFQNIVKASGLSFFQVHFLLSNYWQNKEQLGSVLPEREVLQNIIRSGYKEFKKSTMPLTVIEAINSLYPTPIQANPVEVQIAESPVETTSQTPTAKGKMTFSYGKYKREGITSNTTFDAIKNGERTATTRYESDGNINYWEKLKVGDTIEFESSKGEKLLVEVTKPLHKLSGSGKTPKQWSMLEGWSTEYFDFYVKPKLEEAWQIEFKYIPLATKEALLSKEKQQVNNKIEIITSTYTRQSVQNDSDSMYLFTDNAQRTSRPTATVENVDKNSWYYKKYKSQTNKPIHFGSLNNPSSAVMRGLNNAYPISTMSAYGTDWTNANFELFKTIIDDEIAQIKKDLSKFSKIKISNSRIGQGGMFASLPKQHQAYLDNKLLEIGIDNTGDKPKIVNNNENEILYQLPQGREQEEFVASEKTIRDLAARVSDRIGIPVRFEADKTKKYKGKLENDMVVINLAYATLDTPIHEILGHPIIRAIKQKSDNQLYQNLLKELEYGKGKEVLDKVKRDYQYKGEYEVRPETINGVTKYAIFNTKKNERVRGNQDSINDAENIIKKLKGSDELKYTLEEQQEEAIVELLGLYTADRLDKVKDGKLISLLKRLLKEIKAFMKQLLGQKEVEIDKLPDNMTLGDIADLLAYSNSKLILPGNEVVYTTPDNQQFKTYAEASNHISNLAKSVEDIDLSGITLDFRLSQKDLQEIEELENQKKEKEDYFNSKTYQQYKETELARLNKKLEELGNKKVEFYSQEPSLDLEDKKKYGFQDFDYVRVESTYRRDNIFHDDILGESYEGYYIHGYNTSIGKIEKKILPITKEQAIKIWEKDENSKYEVQDAQKMHRIRVDIKYLQEDRDIKYEISSINQKIHNIKFGQNTINNFIEKNKEYEQAKEIIEEWIRINNIRYNPKEVYSRGQEFISVLGAYSDFDINLMIQNLLQHIEDNQKAGGEFTISAFTKPIDKRISHLEGGGGKIKFKIYPQSQDIKWAANTDVFSGSVWDASEKVSKDKKSELLGVSYTKYPSLISVRNIQPNLANIIDNLAHHHNELGISLTGSNFRLEYDNNIPYSTKKIIDSINSILDQKYGKLVKPEIKKAERKQVGYSLILDFNDGEISIIKEFKNKEDANIALIEERKKQTQEDISRGYEIKVLPKIEQGKQPTQTNETLKESIESIKNKIVRNTDKYVIQQHEEKFVIYDLDEQDAVDIFDNKESALQEINKLNNQIGLKEKEYTSQALINTKVAKLKNVAKKYPRSLIRSEVRPINSNSNLGFTKSELPFQKVSNDSFQQSQQELAKDNKDAKYQQIEELFKSNPELANEVYKTLGFNNYELTMNSFMPKKHWKIGHIIDNPTEAANICDNTQIRVLNYILDKFGKPKEKGTFYAKPVTIWAKSPINDKQIHHYTVAVRVNNKVYLYDMPQSEYIEYVSENKGKVIKEYKPRLIEYTPTNLQFYYGTSNENLHIQDEVILTSDLINLNQLTSQQKQQAIELYSQYIDTIFPDSRVKGIVYRGDENYNMEGKILSRVGGNKYTNGIYFAKSKREATGYINDAKKKFTHVFSAILNLKNPKVTDIYDKEINTNALTENEIDSLKSKNIDGLDIGLSGEQGFEYVVFEPEQIHILGSKKDIEGFKKFIKNKSQNYPIFVVDSSAIDTALGNVIESNGEAKKYNDNLKECM